MTKFTILLTQMVVHHFLHVFLIKMTPYFLNLVNRLQSYTNFYPLFFSHYLTSRSKVTPLTLCRSNGTTVQNEKIYYFNKFPACFCLNYEQGWCLVYKHIPCKKKSIKNTPSWHIDPFVPLPCCNFPVLLVDAMELSFCSTVKNHIFGEKTYFAWIWMASQNSFLVH